MADHAPRLAPRSAGADADFELLRIARTDLADDETAVTPTLAERIRGFAPFRAMRPLDGASADVVRMGNREP